MIRGRLRFLCGDFAPCVSPVFVCGKQESSSRCSFAYETSLLIRHICLFTPISCRFSRLAPRRLPLQFYIWGSGSGKMAPRAPFNCPFRCVPGDRREPIDRTSRERGADVPRQPISNAALWRLSRATCAAARRLIVLVLGDSVSVAPQAGPSIGILGLFECCTTCYGSVRTFRGATYPGPRAKLRAPLSFEPLMLPLSQMHREPGFRHMHDVSLTPREAMAIGSTFVKAPGPVPLWPPATAYIAAGGIAAQTATFMLACSRSPGSCVATPDVPKLHPIRMHAQVRPQVDHRGTSYPIYRWQW